MFKIYSVVIVDDELAARKTLEKYITDFCDDFEIAGIFNDGDEAIEFFENNSADVVLTDVRMPNISGIELAKYIYENNINTKVAIISGYSEFRYAQEAMKYGVVYYQLKVVNVKDFIEMMDKLREILKNEKKLSAEEQKMNCAVFFYDLFGKFFENENVVLKEYRKLNLKTPYEDAVCEILELRINEFELFLEKEWRYGADMFEDTIVNLIKILSESEFVISIKSHEEKFTFIILHGEIPNETEIDNIIYELNNVFGLESVVTERRFIKLENVFSDNSFDLFNKEEKKRIKASKEIEEMEFSQEQIVHKINRYIEENFGKNLTRSNIAEQLYLNEDYLGRIYKNATGKTIVEYLLEVRMTNAKKFIKQGVSIGNICEKIGYSDERNFRRAFRKYTGLSVTEFKKSGALNEG